MLTPEDRQIVKAANRMRFNPDFPPLDGGMDVPPPEAQSDGDPDEDRHEDPDEDRHDGFDAGEEAEVDDHRPRVPSPSDAETLVLGAIPDQEVEAHDRDCRTPRVPSPIVADTEGSVNVTEGETDAQ
eukprot:2720595-Amphidinium_carterae.1